MPSEPAQGGLIKPDVEGGGQGECGLGWNFVYPLLIWRDYLGHSGFARKQRYLLLTRDKRPGDCPRIFGLNSRKVSDCFLSSAFRLSGTAGSGGL